MMTLKEAISLGACILVAIGLTFNLWLAIMYLFDMTVEYTFIMYMGIGFWLGAAFTLVILYRFTEEDDDQSMAE